MSIKKMNELLEEFGKTIALPAPLTADEEGYCCLSVDESLVVHLKYEEEFGTLRFFVGSWEEFSRGGDVALQFDDESWQRWTRASQNAALMVLDGFRRTVIDAADGRLIETHFLDDRANPGEMGLSVSSPAVAGGRIYVGSETGGLRSFSQAARGDGK